MPSLIDLQDHVTAPEGRFIVSPANLIGIAVHHSVSGDYLGESATEAAERAQIQAIDRYHVAQDFGGIGYHMAAFASGRLYLLGDLSGARAHVAGRNHELLGVVAIGTFTERLPGDRQLAALDEAIARMREHAGKELPVKGHADWALPGQGTACPGTLRQVDWDRSVETMRQQDMIRFNGFVAALDGASLAAGARNAELWAAQEFTLPPEARRVRLEVTLTRGAFAAGDASYAGRVDERYGCRLGIIDVDLDASGSLRYDCPPGTIIERIGCLGYWL